MADNLKDIPRKVVIINQAVNYLTIGLANSFNKRFEKVELITGGIHVQGDELDSDIQVRYINKWQETHGIKKFFGYLTAMMRMWFMLIWHYRKYEVLFVSSPPMAYLLNIVLPHRFSMLIWDVYPDVFKITGMSESHPMYRAWSYLNKISFKKAYRIITIGERMADILEAYVSRDKLIIQPIWSIFQEENNIDPKTNPFIKEHNLEDKFVVQYSGNIGLTHRVELMVELADHMKNDEGVLFQIIGRGPRVQKLKSMVQERNLPNCQFLPFQSDEMFPYSLGAANLGVVILDELTSKGSVPSKSYNLMSYGIPSLYFASEDSELFAYCEKYSHAKCYNSQQFEEARQWVLEMKSNPEKYQQYHLNALNASKDFKKTNADLMVSSYISGPESKV